MATYSEWNSWLTDYFFNCNKSNKEVFLAVCPEVINEIGQINNIKSPDDDFINAIRNCDLRKPLHSNMIQTADDLRSEHKNTSYSGDPKYVAFLSFLVYCISISPNLTGKNQIPDLEKKLNESGLREFYNDRVPGIWGALEKWTRINQFEKGRFNAIHIPHYKNVGYAFRQALFRKSDHKLIEDALAKSKVSAGLELDKIQARKILANLPSGTRLAQLFQKSTDTEIKEYLIQRVFDVYNTPQKLDKKTVIFRWNCRLNRLNNSYSGDSFNERQTAKSQCPV